MEVTRRRLLWLIAARAVMVTTLMGGAILVQLNAPGTLPINPFFFLIGLTYALTVAYALTLRLAEAHRWLVDVQLACDAVIVSAMVYLTGGVTSYFSSLYALPVVAASVLQQRRGGLTVGAASALLYVGLVVSQYTGALQLPGASPPSLPAVRVAGFTVGLNVFGFATVAFLSAYLAEGLRRADARLRTASNALADLQAFNQHIIDSLTSGLLTTDQRGDVLTFNRAAEGITGVPAREALGRPVTEVLQLPASIDLLSTAGSRSPGRRLELGFVRSDGRAIELGLSAAPLVTPTGQVGFLVTFQDVTEIKRIERERRLQQRLAAVGEMAAGMAHEIRNPLASISGSLQMLRQELPLSDEQACLLDIVLRESERLNETIRSFLAYARPQRVSTDRLDLRRVLTETATLLRNSVEFREQHDICLELPREALWYDADEGQIRQVLWNLATNGLRAMPDGGRLTLGVAADGAGAVLLTVADEGIGIPPEELDQIFQPFRGAFERGTGLGLAIVHRIVTEYGGDIQVRSQPGAGTRVAVRLPAPVAVA